MVYKNELMEHFWAKFGFPDIYILPSALLFSSPLPGTHTGARGGPTMYSTDDQNDETANLKGLSTDEIAEPLCQNRTE